MYIVFSIILLIILIILIPIKVVIDYEFYSKDYDVNDEDIKQEIKIYIFRFLKVKTIKKLKKEKNNKDDNKESKNSKMIYNIFSMYKTYSKIIKNEKLIGNNALEKLKKNIKFQKLDLSIGYNTKSVILNAYTMAILNSFINSYIAKNATSFNLNDIKYETYISENLLRIKINSIVNIKLVNTIHIIIKLIFKYMKGGKNNGKEASNRRFNANSYDIA